MNTKTTTPIRTKQIMVKEWSSYQFTMMDKALKSHFKNKVIETMHNGYVCMKTKTDIENILGLAYTSTGMFACLGVCNTEAYFDADKIYSYQYFTIGVDGYYYAILQDKDENELCIKL